MPGLAEWASAATEAAQGEVFKLHEASVFDQDNSRFLRGQMAGCEDKPFTAVKRYPTFVSKKPVYGSIRFAADEAQTNAGKLFYFAIDESRGTGKGYDRLYFDLNRDLDLRNDPPLKPQPRPPERANLRWGGLQQQVIFEPLTINFDLGPAGTRPVQIMPRLTISVYDQEEDKLVTFVRTRLYKGELKLGAERYQALLGDDYLIRGRLDQPDTALVLTPQDDSSQSGWLGGDRLKAAHRTGGRLFTFSASPTGEQLTVRPYQGDLGTFEIGPGGRAITNLNVRGSLDAKETAVAVGGDLKDGWPTAAPRCQLPVGDYMPNYITVQFGRLSLSLSHNYHSDGKPRDRLGRPRVYGLAIRKDRPCVLDFSNKPDVMFASPARDQRFKPGDTVMVKAVLTDPELDLMIRRLNDTTRRQAGAGSSGRDLSLDPTVLITRANGEKVAEGVMPFG